MGLIATCGAAAKARTDPAHRAAVIEETLRLHAPLQNATWRFPTEDVEIGGRLMRPGDPILVSVLAADRDPAVFANPTPSGRDSGQRNGGTSPSARARTCASARRWPGCRPTSPSRPCSAVCRRPGSRSPKTN